MRSQHQEDHRQTHTCTLPTHFLNELLLQHRASPPELHKAQKQNISCDRHSFLNFMKLGKRPSAGVATGLRFSMLQMQPSNPTLPNNQTFNQVFCCADFCQVGRTCFQALGVKQHSHTLVERQVDLFHWLWPTTVALRLPARKKLLNFEPE